MAMRILTALLFLAICQAHLSAQQKLSPEGLWSLGRESLEDLHPGGRYAVYTLTRYTIAENSGNTQVFLIDLRSGSSRQLTQLPGHCQNVRFRPGTERIGFLHNGLLKEMDLDGGKMKTISAQEMNGFLYSPAGDRIAFVQDVKYLQTPAEVYPDLPKANARIIDGLLYRHWKSWEDASFSNLFIQELGPDTLKGKALNVSPGTYDVPTAPNGGMEEIAWSPAGDQIAYTCKKLNTTEYALSTNTDIYVYRLSNGATTNVSAPNAGYDREPAWSPDGKYLAWTSMARAGYESDKNRILLRDQASGQLRDLTEGWDNSASGILWAGDSKSILTVGGDKGTHPIYRLPLSGTVSTLAGGTWDYQAILAVDGKTLLASRMSMSQPTEIVSIEQKSGEVKVLTQNNKAQLSSIRMGEVRERWIRTEDGHDMKVWVILPPDFDPARKYPALLYCQGGPQSALSQYWSYRWNFQLMAAQGYIVIAPCRRGMPTFGQAWNDAIMQNWGGQCMRDYLNAVDVIAAEPYVDAERLGAVGASFGGYSVFWLEGHHQKRFKAFIAHCGMFNNTSWYGTTEELFFANNDLGGPYWENPQGEAYTTFSPHTAVDQWDTPILIFHGEKDFRVPLSEGLQAFQAAQLKGIASKMVLFPEEGHWVQGCQNGLLWQREFFSWLDRWLK